MSRQPMYSLGTRLLYNRDPVRVTNMHFQNSNGDMKPVWGGDLDNTSIRQGTRFEDAKVVYEVEVVVSGQCFTRTVPEATLSRE